MRKEWFGAGMIRSGARQVLPILVLALSCSAAQAEAQPHRVSSDIRVSATVRTFSRMHVVSQPRSIELSSEDIARGYVDVPAPMQLAMETNSTAGFTIVFAHEGRHFRSVEVQGGGRQVSFATEGAMNWQLTARREMLELRFRMRLAPELSPGAYPWPLQVSMEPA